MKELVRSFFVEEDGVKVIEVMLVLVVVVALAVVFKDWIINWANQLFASTDAQVQDAVDTGGLKGPGGN